MNGLIFWTFNIINSFLTVFSPFFREMQQVFPFNKIKRNNNNVLISFFSLGNHLLMIVKISKEYE